jgi:hypothetical protein
MKKKMSLFTKIKVQAREAHISVTLELQVMLRQAIVLPVGHGLHLGEQ